MAHSFWSLAGFLVAWPDGVEARPYIMVLGVGGFAQSGMQILSDDGAGVSCGLTRNYGQLSPTLAGPAFDVASADSLPGLVEGQGIDLVVPMSIDWAKAPWTEALLNGPADLLSLIHI